jgi:hypothetical protein
LGPGAQQLLADDRGHLGRAAAAQHELPRAAVPHPTWTLDNLGKIFGLTLDSDGNLYVAPTSAYGANPSPATIKRIDGVTGEITDFATLPNNGPAMGNLNYDCVSQTIYVSNFEDGRIYQIDMSGRSSAPTTTGP